MIATLDQIGINEATQYYDATLLEVIFHKILNCVFYFFNQLKRVLKLMHNSLWPVIQMKIILLIL